MALLAVDVREACLRKLTGKGQWAYGFVNELLKRQKEVALYSDLSVPREWESMTNKIYMFKQGLKWHFMVSKHICSVIQDCIYISPTSFIVPFLICRNIRVVPIVHDLIAFQNEPHDLKAKYIERLLFKRVVKNAFHICTVSNNTKEDLNKMYPFTSDISSSIFAGPMSESVPVNRPDKKTILCIGTLCPRKNQYRLIKAYQRLPDRLKIQYKLILVGSRGWNDHDVIEEANRTAGVHWIGHVSDDEYQSLLSTCDVFAFPSLYEGFGLQILDAMQRGAHILASDRASLPEITANAALYVNPENIDSISNGLLRLLCDNDLRAKLRFEGPRQANKYSWKRTVDLFLESIYF